jgi:hypothetical protein
MKRREQDKVNTPALREYLRDYWILEDELERGGFPASRWIRFLRWVALLAPFGMRIIWSRDGSSPYLLRVNLTPRLSFWPAFPVAFLHFFFRGDDDVEHHNHPWDRALSVILSKGYREERLMETRTSFGVIRDVFTIRRRPGDAFWIRGDDFHRVRLYASGRPWTLFFAGERNNLPDEMSWAFKHPTTGLVTPWQEHVNQKREGRPWPEREAA